MPINTPYKNYNGGGTANALQTDATAANVVAGGATLQDSGGASAVDVQLMSETAGDNCVLFCAEYNLPPGGTLAAANLVRYQEKTISSVDLVGTVTESLFKSGGSGENKPKAPVRFSLLPGSTFVLGTASVGTGPFYARIALLKGADEPTIDIAAPGESSTTAPITKALTKVVKAVTTASTAVKLVASTTYARTIELQAKKVAADNAGNVFIGLSDLDQGTAELIELSPGDSWYFEAPEGTKIDLSTIYVDADNSADGVVGWYLAV